MQELQSFSGKVSGKSLSSYELTEYNFSEQLKLVLFMNLEILGKGAVGVS